MQPLKITAVTGFYDVGRGGYDGRTVDEYIGWLNKTLQVPLPFLVFLAPSFDASSVVLKPEDRIVRVPKNQLKMFRHRDKVEEIIVTSSTVNRRDISFNLAEYGLVVMSKPELMKRAAHETDADFLLWIDAGLSRFLPDLSSASVTVSTHDLDGIKMSLSTSYHFAQRARIGRFPKKLVGYAQSMMSAGDFLVARDYAKELSNRINFLVETEWLPNNLWDNEQVAIGCLLFRGGLPGADILHTDIGPLAPTTRWLFGVPFYDRKMALDESYKLLRDEVRTRCTPIEDCYLPGDFPEVTYRAWTQLKD